jgi:hypothetical protein
MSRVLYFVGAGLTKALALPTRPVPAMLDFIRTCAEYTDDPVILTTLAELENATPYPYTWVSAAARELAPRLVGQNRSDDPAIRSAFVRALRERPGESIEDLLDRTGGGASNRSSQSADTRFRYAIQRLFTIIGWDLGLEPLISFLKRRFEQRDDAQTFVSFNYDLALDRGIQLAIEGDLDFRKLYGFPIVWQVTGDPPPSMDDVSDGGAFGGGLQATTIPVRDMPGELLVLKPHGSLNWLTPTRDPYPEPQGDDLRQGRSVILPLDAGGALRYLPTTNLPPWVQLPSQEPITGVEPVLLTPRTAKRPDRPFLRVVREREEAAILEADEVFILGWSIPRTDTDQECLIRYMVGKRPQPFQRVTAINYSADADYYLRVAEIFGVDRNAVRTFNAGFREFVESTWEAADVHSVVGMRSRVALAL